MRRNLENLNDMLLMKGESACTNVSSSVKKSVGRNGYKKRRKLHKEHVMKS